MDEYLIILHHGVHLRFPLNVDGNLEHQTIYPFFPNMVGLKFLSGGAYTIIRFSEGFFMKPYGGWPYEVEVVLKEGDSPDLGFLQLQEDIKTIRMSMVTKDELNVVKETIVTEINTAITGLLTQTDLEQAKSQMMSIMGFKLQLPTFGLKQMVNLPKNLFNEYLTKNLKEKKKKLRKAKMKNK